MHAMVPLLLDWLSESPDPDLGLLGLRRLATGLHRRSQLSTLFRESPEAARQLCLLLGTSPLFAGRLRAPSRTSWPCSGKARTALPGRDDIAAAGPREHGLAAAGRSGGGGWPASSGANCCGPRRATSSGRADVPETALSLTRLAEAVVEVALSAVAATRARPGGRRLALACPAVEVWPWWPWAASAEPSSPTPATSTSCSSSTTPSVPAEDGRALRRGASSS